MRYHEIIREDNDAMDPVRNAVIDILTPLVSNGVQVVSVQQILDKLKDSDTGIAIDRSLLMQILDPDQVKIVKSIEGDRINLNTGNDGSQRAVTQKQQQSEQDKIKNTAADQAKKNISS
jgi:pyridoxine 5'-phosphate synthase PdxJ